MTVLHKTLVLMAWLGTAATFIGVIANHFWKFPPGIVVQVAAIVAVVGLFGAMLAGKLAK